VYAWDVDPAKNWESYLCRASNSSTQATVDNGFGRFIDLPNGHQVLWLYAAVEVRWERRARNQVLVLARILDKLQHPPRLHYPTPQAGEGSVAMHLALRATRRPKKLIHVSHRNLFNRQIV
jgi:hypothetical protein